MGLTHDTIVQATFLVGVDRDRCDWGSSSHPPRHFEVLHCLMTVETFQSTLRSPGFEIPLRGKNVVFKVDLVGIFENPGFEV